MPMTCGRPSSPRRAMKQHTFVVPTSRAAVRSPPVVNLALRMIPWPPLRVVARLALQDGRGAEPDHEPVRHPHVDGGDVPGENALLLLEPGQHRPGDLRRI